MTTREMGIEEARKQLGDLVLDAQRDSTATRITRNGRRAAILVPDTLADSGTMADLIGWGTSAEGLAALKAACEFAQRTGMSVTQSEVCAIVTAAHEAEVTAKQGSKEQDQ